MQFNIFIILLYIGLLALLIKCYQKIRVKTVKKIISPISGEIIVKLHGTNNYLLIMGQITQGMSSNARAIKGSYWERIANICANHCKKKNNASVLFIGLGANTSSLLLHNQNQNIQINIIEIDPEIIKIANEYFNLNKMINTHIQCGDIYKLLNENTIQNAPFDCIVTDIVSKNKEFFEINRETKDYITKIKKLLKKNGLLIFNRPAHETNFRQENEQLCTMLQKEFKSVQKEYIKDQNNFKNEIIIASNL